jgi:signal transduction histidine kinase
MRVFDPSLVQLILLILLACLYLPVILFAVQRLEKQESAGWLVILYAMLAFIIGFFDALWRGGKIDISGRIFQNIQAYGALALSFILLLEVYAFLRRTTWWTWFGVAAFWALGLAILIPDVLGLGEQAVTIWSALGWAVFMAGMVRVIYIEYRQTHQPLYRNRLSYWTLILIFVFVNDLMIFSRAPLPGDLLRLAAAIIAAYVILTHHISDLRQIIRIGLVYTITLLLIVVFYIAAFIFSQSAFSGAPKFNPMLVGGVIALLLAVIFTPLLSLVRRVIHSWLNVDQYDPGRTLHEYSESISNILDMERLATVAIGIIIEAMEIERGFLFLIDQEKDEFGRNTYRLRPIRSPGERSIPNLELDESNPIASTLTHEVRPLLQYDLDLLPAYRAVSSFQREWFNNLHSEVYIPIFAKRKWSGLLALGSKLSGNRYTAEDLVTLSALANQTAVALENARLVDNLMRLNNELRKARRDLETSNLTLQKMDETKSDFINIASHELRSPLTVIRGYTEMLIGDTGLDSNYRAIIKGIHEGTIRLHEVMDSMFDITQISASSHKLHVQYIDIGEIVRDVCNMQKKVLHERSQSIAVKLPSLPNLQADPNLIEKLFQHLIVNAIKFTPNEGRITVTGRMIDPNESDLPQGSVEIVVADTGVGVDPTYHDIIFSKFYQPGELSKHSTGKTRFKGSGVGLGLALCKGIVEAHGGRIWVESPGHDEVNFPGSQFHITLPLTKQAEIDSLKMGAEVNLNF